jgi:hypothetical protein
MQNKPEQEQAAQKILDDNKARAHQERIAEKFQALRADVDKAGILRPEKTLDRHYTEEHRLVRCTCWSPHLWPKEELPANN